MKRFTLATLLLVFLLTLSLSVSAEEVPRVTISLLDYTPDPVQPGQVIDLTLQLDNEGSVSSRASLEIIDDYPFIIEKSQDLELAKDLKQVGYSRKLQFRIRIDEDAKDGLAPLRVRYNDDNLPGGYIESTFDINIQTFNAQINILKIEQEPEELEPGQRGKLIITLQNADDTALSNVDATLDVTNTFDPMTVMENTIAVQSMINARLEQVNRRVASGLSPLSGATPMMNPSADMGEGSDFDFTVIAPVGSSNQKSMGVIKANRLVRLEYDIMAVPDITAGVYAIPFYLNYNDEDNNPFHLRVDIPLLINTEPDLYLEMKSTTLRTTDFAAETVFTVANRGLSELRYVTIEVKETEDLTVLTAPKSIYIGTLAPGESKEGTFTLLAHENDLTIPVVAQYRDSFNNKKEETRNIEHLIINKNYYRDLPYEMWISWLILGLVVLALTGFYVWHMSKKK